MRKICIFSICLIVVLLVIGSAQAIAVVKVENGSAPKDQTTTVNITVENVEDLANFNINVTYDPSVVIVTAATNNPAFGTPLNNLEHASEGYVRLGTLNLGQGVSGSTWLSKLTLKAVGNPGDTTYLNLTVEEFFNSNEEDIPFTVQNGTFTVLSVQDTTPPILTFVDPTPLNNSAINQKYMIVNVSSNKPLSNAFIHIQVWNGTAWVDDKGNIGEIVLPMNKTSDTVWWINIKPPTDVYIRYWVNGSDLAGNDNKTEVRYLKISGYPPQIYTVSPTEVPLNAEVNMTVVIYDVTPSTYKVYRNGSLVEEGDYSFLEPFNVSIDTSQVGTWNYTIWANDSFGNTNQTTIIVTVFQPTVPEIIAPNVVAKPLEIIRVPILLNNITDATGVGFNLTFNPDTIRVLGVEANTTYFTNVSIPDYNMDNKTGFVSLAYISYDPATTTQPQPVVDLIVRVIANETFAYLNFTFAEISLKPPEFELIAPIKINGSVTVVGLKGDLNDNGRIDIGDVAKVGYMGVKKIPYDPRADFNLNGEIDITDVTKIASYYVGKISEI